MTKSDFTSKRIILPGVYVLIVLFSLCSCSDNGRQGIVFEYVDPLEKVLAEASYFRPQEAISEVVRGENATLQFIVRSNNSITNLRINVTQAVNNGNLLPPAKTGFVGYVKVGRSIWDYSRDRIVS